jgi:hypothetical protein
MAWAVTQYPVSVLVTSTWTALFWPVLKKASNSAWAAKRPESSPYGNAVYRTSGSDTSTVYLWGALIVSPSTEHLESKRRVIQKLVPLDLVLEEDRKPAGDF